MGVPGLGTPQAGLQQQGQVPEGLLQWSQEDQQHHGQGGSTRDIGVYQGFCPRKSGRCQGTRCWSACLDILLGTSLYSWQILVVIRCHPTVQALPQLSLVTKEVDRDRSINKNEQGLVFKLGEEEMRFNQHSSVGHDGVQHCQVVGGD